MHHILSLFMFQASRQRLLSSINQAIDAASAHREEHGRQKKAEDEEEKRKIDNLERARQAADQELQDLEYWSDIKDSVRKGESSGAASSAHGWDAGWAGIDDSGPKVTAGPPEDDSKEVFANGQIQIDTSKTAGPSLVHEGQHTG